MLEFFVTAEKKNRSRCARHFSFRKSMDCVASTQSIYVL